jgi:hypothetical protein
MKAVIHDILVEGTLEEILELINRFKSHQRLFGPDKETDSTSGASNKINTSKKSNVLRPVSSGSRQKKAKSLISLKDADNFVSALYRYSPSKTGLGKQAYVIKMLATGKIYTIKYLAREAEANAVTVKRAIIRAVSAGCIIEATNLSAKKQEKLTGQRVLWQNITQLNLNSKVRMLALGTVETARAARLSHKEEKTASAIIPILASRANRRKKKFHTVADVLSSLTSKADVPQAPTSETPIDTGI